MKYEVANIVAGSDYLSPLVSFQKECFITTLSFQNWLQKWFPSSASK